MRPLFTPEQTAAMELAGYALALLELDAVRDHLVPGLQTKLSAYCATVGMPEPFPKPRMLEAAE